MLTIINAVWMMYRNADLNTFLVTSHQGHSFYGSLYNPCYLLPLRTVSTNRLYALLNKFLRAVRRFDLLKSPVGFLYI